MIDLRSDTLTLPSEGMLKTILTSKLGDDGRVDENGRGEDLTVNELENLSALLTGKEEGVLFSSGTLANTTAIMTCCSPGDKVLVDEILHIYKSEKVVFDKDFGRMIPIFYRLNDSNKPDLLHLRQLMKENNIKLLCIENTHNFSGGVCLEPNELKEIYNLAKEYNVHVHMDGARLFNAAVALDVDVKELCNYTDTLMFCISKGLGAPVGSLLCGNKDFIKKARQKRKLLGGNMRQAGIIAAPGIYALNNNIENLKTDNENAKYVAENIKNLRKTDIQENVQSNIIVLDISRTGLTPEEYCDKAKENGLLIRPVLENKVRMVFYNGINRKNADEVINIIRNIDDSF